MSSRILGMGCVTPIGNSLQEIHEAWRQGQLPETSLDKVLAQGQWHDFPILTAKSFELEGSPAAYRRLSVLGKMALFATHQALKDANLQKANDGHRWGILVASGFGPESCSQKNMSNIYSQEDGMASPILFTNSVNNSIASGLARAYGISGPSLTIADHSNLIAGPLLMADLWLKSRTVDYVIAVFGEENSMLRNYFEFLERQKSGQALTNDTSQSTSEACLSIILGNEEIASRYPKIEIPRNLGDSTSILENIRLNDQHPKVWFSKQQELDRKSLSFLQLIGKNPINKMLELAFVAYCLSLN